MNIESLRDLVEKTKDLKVLYVEDNQEARVQAVKMLNNFFRYIDVAVDGADGLEKFKKDKFDLIISDINMPNMNGIEMIETILQRDSKQNILVITAHNNPKYLQEMIDIGIKNYIHKPITMDSMIYELSKIVETIEKRKIEDENFIKITKLNHELDALVDSFDTYVIASRTDLKGIITYASKAYEKISGYSKEELIGKPHNIVRHPDMPASAFRDMWKTIKAGKLWVGEVKNLKKDGGYYWVEAHIAPYYDANGKHIGYSAIRINITSQKKIEKLNSDIKNLLNNMGQGLLSFDKNFKIDESFSKECLTIFEKRDIKNRNISELLFTDDTAKKDLFEEGIKRIVSADDEMTKELFLSLLPNEHIINNKNIKIKYKILPNDRLMLILTDITQKKKLEHKIKQQSKIQNMIVSVASNRRDFIDIKKDFEKFISTPEPKLEIFKRRLHTFKGIFAQKNMPNITNAIHNFETFIDNNQHISHLEFLEKQYALNDIFKKDLKIIKDTLGKDFLEAEDNVIVDKELIDSIKIKLQRLQKSSNKIDLCDILKDFERLNHISIYKMLYPYISMVESSSKKRQKSIEKLKINGDRSLKVPKTIEPFIKSLIHLFNNCIEHGIEDSETRINRNKNESGKIECGYEYENAHLKITIEDDGGGIDVERLSKSAVKKDIKTQSEIDNMSEYEKIFLIFEDDLSTKESVSVTSGRGVGMSAVRYELEKLDGKIDIENRKNLGVKFTFTIPY